MVAGTRDQQHVGGYVVVDGGLVVEFNLDVLVRAVFAHPWFLTKLVFGVDVAVDDDSWVQVALEVKGLTLQNGDASCD